MNLVITFKPDTLEESLREFCYPSLGFEIHHRLFGSPMNIIDNFVI